MRAPSGSSLPRLGPRSAANAVLRPLFSAVRGGTVTDVNSVVITEHRAILLPKLNLRAHRFAYARDIATLGASAAPSPLPWHQSTTARPAEGFDAPCVLARLPVSLAPPFRPL